MSGFTKEKLAGLNKGVTMMIGNSNLILQFQEKWLRMGLLKRLYWLLTGKVS